MAGALLAGEPQQLGVVYRIQQETDMGGIRRGTVWVVGEDARLEYDPAEEAGALGIVRIWKAGGKQELRLDTEARTYFDVDAYQRNNVTTRVSVRTLEVLGAPPLTAIKSVRQIRFDVQPLTVQQISSSGATPDCTPVSVGLSYELVLRLSLPGQRLPKGADAPFRSQVEATGEFCLSESLPVASLPFLHGRFEIVSGIPEVDALVARRLAALRGVAVRSALTAKRHVEAGDEISETRSLVLSDFRTVEVPADYFVVPADFRYQEPIVVAPAVQREQH
jgi:hypothetical protein